MLARIETLYLNLLRGFIIFLATLALVAALFFAIAAIPSLIERMGAAKADTSALTLARFVSEQRPTVEQEASGTIEIPVDPLIARSAKNAKSYLGSRSNIPLKAFEGMLTKSQENIPAVARPDYANSLIRLTEEIKSSRGKPLSEARVLSLLAWHESRFTSEWEKDAARKADADAALRYRVWGAGAAFIAFLLVIFVFLFVRVERNTRLVRIAREYEDA